MGEEVSGVNQEVKEAPVVSLQNLSIREVLVTSELVKEWRQQYINEGRTVASANTYYSVLKKFVGYELRVSQKSVNIFRSKNMNSFDSGALKTFFKFLVDKKEFPEWLLDIRFGRNKKVERQPKSITLSEALKVIKGMEPYGVKYQNMSILLFYLGLRISEGINLLWEDFEWDTWLKDKNEDGIVTLKHTKGGKFRVIPVPPDVMLKIYNDHCKDPQNVSSTGIPLGYHVCDFDYLDYVHTDNPGIKETKEEKENRIKEEKYRYIVHAESMYRDLLSKVSIDVLGKKINPHIFRHARAQYLMNKGLGIEFIKSFLGHSSLTSTEIYAQASPELLRKEMKRIREENKDA